MYNSVNRPQPVMGSPGEKLRQLRIDQGMSQCGLADKSGVSWETISNIEMGRFPTTLFQVRASLSAALNVKRSDIWPDDKSGPIQLPTGIDLRKTERARR